MNWKLWVCGAMVATMANGRVFGETPARGEAGRSALPGEWSAVPGELGLTDDQTAKLKEKYQVATAARKDWEKQNKDKAERLRAELMAAQQAKNEQAVQKAKEQLQTILEERGKGEADFNKQMMDALTPEQQATWLGLKAYRGEYAAMAKSVGLSSNQEAQLKETVKTQAMALAKWDEANAERIKTLEQQSREVRAALDALQAEKAKLQVGNGAAITAILTPEQRTAWTAQKLMQEAGGRLARLKATDDQIAKATALAEAAAKELGPDTLADRKAFDQAREKLYKTIVEQVLTDDQRAQMSGRPAVAARTPETPKSRETPKQ